MRVFTRSIAITQLALIFPAVLFLTSVFVAIGKPPQYDLARLAHQIVSWYAARTWTLSLLLLALPCIALLTGLATLMRSWNNGAELRVPARHSLAMIPAPLATLLVAGTTLVSSGILAIVALHMLAN